MNAAWNQAVLDDGLSVSQLWIILLDIFRLEQGCLIGGMQAAGSTERVDLQPLGSHLAAASLITLPAPGALGFPMSSASSAFPRE